MAVALSFPPAQPNPILDRTVELEAIVRRLTVEQVRLLSLTGPAGVGKTRLALEASARVAGHFRDGVTLVDLTPIRESRFVLPAIAQALGLQDTGTRPLTERLQEYLQDWELLTHELEHLTLSIRQSRFRVGLICSFGLDGRVLFGIEQRQHFGANVFRLPGASDLHSLV
jgi:hypothetical protein